MPRRSATSGRRNRGNCGDSPDTGIPATCSKSAATPARRWMWPGRWGGMPKASSRVSRPARLRERELGLDVFTGTVDAAAFPADSFDVIFTNAVMEHLCDPLSVLRECRRILRPGGVFYADTVNWDSYTRRLLGAALEVPFSSGPCASVHAPQCGSAVRAGGPGAREDLDLGRAVHRAVAPRISQSMVLASVQGAALLHGSLDRQGGSHPVPGEESRCAESLIRSLVCADGETLPIRR